MVSKCAALGCKNKSGKENGNAVGFHSFPKDPELLAQWITAIGKNDWTPSKHSRLCSGHFKSEDYYPNTNLRLLRPNVVPSVFKVNSHKKKGKLIKVRLPFELYMKKKKKEHDDKDDSKNEAANDKINVNEVIPSVNVTINTRS